MKRQQQAMDGVWYCMYVSDLPLMTPSGLSMGIILKTNFSRSDWAASLNRYSNTPREEEYSALHIFAATNNILHVLAFAFKTCVANRLNCLLQLCMCVLYLS